MRLFYTGADRRLSALRSCFVIPRQALVSWGIFHWISSSIRGNRICPGKGFTLPARFVTLSIFLSLFSYGGVLNFAHDS